LKENKARPYKLQVHQELKHADPPLRMAFANTILPLIQANPNFVRNICFTDEATLFLNDEFNRQNYRYWSKINPRWYAGLRSRAAYKVNIWAGFFGNESIGTFFFADSINGISYLLMFQQRVLPALLGSATRQGIPHQYIYFQHDGAPAHFAQTARAWLDLQFPNRWIGRGGPIAWPARSPDFAPMDFFAWGYMRQKIFTPIRPQTPQALRNGIQHFFNGITPAVLQNVRTGFVKRLQQCLAVNGGHYEHLIK